MSDIGKWDARYREAGEPMPARVLSENLHLLPARGCALDLACGLGANALLLARCGLESFAWDSSPVAIEKLRAAAAAAGVAVHAELRDVVAQPPEPQGFDVIVVAHFLDRGLAPALVAALRPGGLLFYQTFTRARGGASGPRNPDYLLRENELLRLFSALQPIVYREEGTLGDLARGFRDQALLVAAKAALKY